MSIDPLQVVLGYHEATKHHPGRYARSLGYLDWATQPNPFRRFEGAPQFPLPTSEQPPAVSYDQLFSPGGVRPQPLNLASVSMLFYLSLALSAWKQAGETRWALRCNPSSGNLHPTEGYAILPAMAGLTASPGVFHYAPREHALEQRARWSQETFSRLTQALPQPCLLVGLSSIWWREAWKYGERAFRYCHHDLGHALGAVRLAAAALGWRLQVLERLGDADIARLLGLDRAEDFADAEPESPDLLAVVFPSDRAESVPLDLPAESIARVAGETWLGRANALSSDHAVWDIIDAVGVATIKPRTHEWVAAPIHASPMAPAERVNDASAPPRETSAFQVIRTRRSAVAFDGRTAITREALYAMLARVMPGPRPPWDCCAGPAHVHLLLFVHRVDGLQPGLYLLAREETAATELRQCCATPFAWETPPECPSEVPLFLLEPADCRRAAAQLSLGQAIAGDSAFSLGMLARFEPALRAYGPWYYRRLFREAGLIGQVLYLEAEAAERRATGIGAYFDDQVHAVLGLRDRSYQSLYHFTIGTPVEDPRVISAPAYPGRTS